MSDKERLAQQYDKHRALQAAKQAEMAEAGQDIGTPPPVKHPRRRKSCERDFQRFCETYFSPVFYLGWSEDHLRAIRKIESAVLEGKLFALAMPRGTGKTSLCLAAVIWAALYGHARFICLIAASERRARRLLQIGIYNVLERNQPLYEDFPEVCHPIRKLERTPQRAPKQKCDGRYTSIVWTKTEVVLPTVEVQETVGRGKKARVKRRLSDASGTIITACGLTGGEVRGQVKDTADGGMMRPELVLLDDPQTKASAKSPTQTQDRLELLQGDVLGMAGPDRTITGMLPCTVIRPGDMADQILDTEKHPEWHGERTKLVYAWPESEALWEEYASILRQGLRRGDGSAATEFYRKNQAAMDAGSRVAWPERHPKTCISALQHAMNLKIRDETAFFSEYQNEPLVEQEEDEMLTPEQIAAKLNGRKQGTVPASCSKLAMYIDVHKKLLYWVVMAFDPDFTAYLIDYGAYPDPRRQYFTMREARRSLMTACRGKGEEAAIYAGLEEVVSQNLARVWTRDDGAEMRIGLCLIDAGYQKDAVELFCRQSRYSGQVMPAKGLPITASSIPLEERKSQKGYEVGDNWRVTASQGKYAVRLVEIDVNHWKTFLHARLAVPMGGKGCLSLWGRSDTRHRMLSEHWTAEYRTQTEGRGRKLYEWKHKPHKPDNHLFDAAVGTMAAASMLGCSLMARVLPRRRRKPVKRKAKYLK